MDSSWNIFFWGIGALFVFVLMQILFMAVSYNLHYRRIDSRIPRQKTKFPFFLWVDSPKDSYEKILLKEARDQSNLPIPIAIHGPSPEGKVMLLVSDADMIREIMSDVITFGKSPLQGRLMEIMLGQNILSLEGEKWKKERKLLSPLFHFGALKRYAEIFNSLSNELISDLKLRKGEAIPSHFIKDYMLKGIAKTAFGDGIDTNIVIAEQKKMFEALGTVWALLNFVGEFMLSFPIPTLLAAARAKQILSVEIEKLIQLRRTQIIKQEDPTDLISLMLFSQENLSKEFILGEGLTFLIGGSDTISSAMQWVFYFLSKYPDVQSKMQLEIDSVFQSNRTGTSIDQLLPQFSYCHKFFLECLRIRPPSPIIFRRVNKDCTLKGYKIPQGVDVITFIHNAHLDERYWDKPHEFQPERFKNEGSAQRHPFSFIPFSAGERNCIGQKFALEEALVIIVNLLKNFNVRSPNLDKIFPAMIEFQHRPRGLMVQFIPRSLN